LLNESKMKQAFLTWLDHRTGVRRIVHEALYENIPGGARWRYVWGSTLVFAFTVQLITGIFLWAAYSPSSQTAWESVFYIQHEMIGGWLVRGIHHFMAQAMVVLLGLHLMQVVIDGAYRAPREVNFWMGLILMCLVLGLSLTGYLLPWDQKGYWATKVATNLLSLVPLVGTHLQKLVVGGPEYGHHTLTRFFALHAGVLPGLLILFLIIHLALFRRHGIKAHKPDAYPAQTFWPDQVLRDAVASLAVLVVVLGLVTWRGVIGEHEGSLPNEHLGAELGAPANPAVNYDAARPEWYFLFLFQFLKLFEGQGETGEFLGAIVFPGLAMLMLFLMPLVGRWKLGHFFNVGFLCALVVGVAALTGIAIHEDRNNASYTDAVDKAEKDAHHAVMLAAKSRRRVPVQGAAWALENSPVTVFKAKCASCHTYVDKDGNGIRETAKPTAPNLYGFATREWIRGLLTPDNITGPDYFGNTKHKDGDMVSFVKDPEGQTGTAFTQEELNDVSIALSAEAQLDSQRKADKNDAQRIAAGRALLADSGRCGQCHQFHETEGSGEAPSLTGYGSIEWIVQFIADPTRKEYYPGDRNDRMPSFCKSPLFAEQNELTPEQIRFLAEFLRGEWYEPQEE
jgi:ubiquinol-cytochrome c reductase cytochrome b subunit